MINGRTGLKILLIGDSLGGGGAERVHANLSLYFTSQGLEVHNCIFVDDVRYEYAGSLLNLGAIAGDESSIKRKYTRLKALVRYIRLHKPDYAIDFRMHYSFMQEYILTRFVFPGNTVYTVHSGILSYYFPQSQYLARLLYKNRKIVAVSTALKHLIITQAYSADVVCIGNPIAPEMPDIELTEELPQKYILAVGGMQTDVKQFGKLIRSYSKSVLPQMAVKLLILGEGKFKEKYLQLAKDLTVANYVIFRNYQLNPFPYYKYAMFLVLSSKYEGFSNVLAESLSMGTPVISFDCFSGPADIINDRENGLLVSNQEFYKLIEAMNLLVSDTELYDRCKRNAKQSVQKFSLDNIGRQWMDYLKINVS